MADFDPFESNDAPQQEEDPAADFLAREQDELKGLEDDSDFGQQQQQQPPQESQSLEGDFLDGTTQDQVESNEFSAPGESYTDDFMGGGNYDAVPGLNDLDDRLNEEENKDQYASVRGVDIERKEPEKLRIWREEQIETLAKKDAAEAEKMAEWRELAKKELEDWYKHRDEQLDKTKKNNLEAEAVFVKERDDTLPGGEWERICRVCEFNPKNSRNTKDVSRMRSILLQLKQNPVSPGQQA